MLILRALFVIAVSILGSAQSVFAERTFEDYERYFCGGAMNANWGSLRSYAEVEAKLPIEFALANTTCGLSIGNSDQYVGNMLHASIRMSPDAQDFVSSVTTYLLKENATPENRHIFVSLVLGDGVDHNVFRQLRSTWTNMPGRRDIAMYAARVICMSIDRYNIIELADIRANECNTPPFVEPW